MTLTGSHRAKGGTVRVDFDVSQMLRITAVKLGGDFASRIPAPQRARLEKAMEGASLDLEVLLTVAKRAFQEVGVAVEGFSPEDVAAAFMAA
jgi:hypothetical protein